MVFSRTDNYTPLGATKLYGCWTQNVEKFDASSFYNWEQDNLPVHDLEERTHFLWEKAGYAPSTVNGLTFVVSSGATNQQIGCNSNVFQSVSAAVRALPEVIRFPVVIEIASFGNLGSLNLNGLQFTENGSLEIINRNAMKCNAGSSLNALEVAYYYTAKATADNSNIYSSYSYPSLIQSYDICATFSETSAVSISAQIFSAAPYDDARRTTGTHGFLMIPGYSDTYPAQQIMPYDRLYGMINSTTFYTTSIFQYTQTWRDYGQYNSTEVTPFDASCVDYISNTEVIVPQRSIDVLIGAIYNNYFESIQIKNCNGPIYIRNLFVHGELTRSYGFDIENCTLTLDNCAAARCVKAGFNIANSNITFVRGLYAYRNYGVGTLGNGTTRLTGNYRDFVRNEVYERLDSAAGLKSLNSNLLFSSNSDWENQVYATTFGSNPRNVSAGAFAIAFDRNYNGLHLINSNLYGLKPRVESNLFAVRDTGYLCAGNNVNAGILLENSNIFWDGRILASNNTKGIESKHSSLFVDNLAVRGNQRVGLVANNSEIYYNKNSYPNSILLEETAGVNYFSMWFEDNGQHIILDTSKFDVKDISGLASRAGTFRTSDNFWLNTKSTSISGVGQSPGIELFNSYAKLVGLFADRAVSKYLIDDPEKGSIISAKQNSRVVSQASKLIPSIIFGNTVPASLSRRKYNVALYAGDNSIVELNGPHYIESFGVNLMAENNSTIKIGPHLDKHGNLDISGWNLSDTGNHTTVELRSQRSCIVVDKNSLLEVKDLGDFRECWSQGALGATIISSSGVDYDTRQTSGYTYRGSLQFYPNPVEDNYPDTPGPLLAGLGAAFYHTDGGDTGDRNYFRTDAIFDPATAYQVSAASLGGWCVRILGNSIAKITNVNFPAGWWNTSGAIYDVSGELPGNPLCSRLFMWNIADNSQLNASYLSVSGLFPQDAGYYGPSSVWSSGTGGISYGAPAGTPDTSSLSVLDWFGGIALSALPKPNGTSPKLDFGFSPPENKGPFRLYVHTDPATTNLSLSADSNEYGYVNQLYAQGYNPAGNIYAPSSVSGVYASLVKWNGTSYVTSGFYYCSGFTPEAGHRIILDESAANTFANAKNGASAKSGRPRICTILLPYQTSVLGNSSTTKKWGKGLQSIQVFDLEKDN